MSETSGRGAAARIRYATSLILLGLVSVFAVQNIGKIEVNFLLWSITTFRFVIIGLSFAIGAAVGWLLRGAR